MVATTSESTPVLIDADGVQVRTREIGGDLTVCFVRLPAGTDLGPALVGLPDDLCPCPHRGYLLSGRIDIRTADGSETYRGGEAFYWPPGHAPVAVEDSAYVDFSPSADLAGVLAHLTGGAR